MRLGLETRTVLLAVASVIAAIALSSLFLMRYFAEELEPEIHEYAYAVGRSVAVTLEKAVGYGIPFGQLRGVERYLDEVREDHPAVLYMTVTNRRGTVLHHSGADATLAVGGMVELTAGVDGRGGYALEGYYNTYQPIAVAGTEIGTLHVGQDRGLALERLWEIGFDLVTVIVVSSLVALELLYFVFRHTFPSPRNATRELGGHKGSDGTPSRAGAGVIVGAGAGGDDWSCRLDRRKGAASNDCRGALRGILRSRGAWDRVRGCAARLRSEHHRMAPEHPGGLGGNGMPYVRPALFLLVFAESLSLSFFPMYVDELYSPLTGVPREVVLGLPISLFMLVWALSLPWAGGWSDRVGRRRPLVIGALVTAAGLLLTGLSHGIYDLLLWRSLTAIGYGITFITCQGYLTDHSLPGQRTRSMAVFLSAFFSGALCGAAIGGIVAERLGYSVTFLLSAYLAVVCALFVFWFIPERRQPVVSFTGKGFTPDFRVVFRNKRFLVVTFFAAIPAKICLTGFLYYTAPLFLQHLGASQSNAGRMIMAYGLSVMMVSPLSARLADRMAGGRLLIIAGGLLASGAIVLPHFYESTLAMTLSICLLGVAHGVSVSPQVPLIVEALEREGEKIGTGAAIGLFRFVERIGNIAGPLIAGVLIANFSYSGAFIGLGSIAFLGIVVFGALWAFFNLRDRCGETVVNVSA